MGSAYKNTMISFKAIIVTTLEQSVTSQRSTDDMWNMLPEMTL